MEQANDLGEPFSDSAPEVIPSLRIVMQVEKGLKSCDGRFTMGCLKPLVNGRREEQARMASNSLLRQRSFV